MIMVHDCVVESNYLSYWNNRLSNLCCFGEDFEGIKPRLVSYSVPYCSWIYIILAFMVLISIADQLIANRKMGIMALLHLAQTFLLCGMNKYLTLNFID
ncbi:hypothetical protein Peur_054745 [Populus x canadensis]